MPAPTTATYLLGPYIMLRSANPSPSLATTAGRHAGDLSARSSLRPPKSKQRMIRAIIPTIIAGAWLMIMVVFADSFRSWWLGLAHSPRYEVHVRIGAQNFGSFEHIVLAGTDLLTHLPYSFNALTSRQKTSGWPLRLSDLLTQYPTPLRQDSSSRALWSEGTIPLHQHLFIKRYAVAGEGIYDWLKSISHHHQTPQQIDLILTQIEYPARASSHPYNRGDPTLTPMTQISLFSATPFVWSVESNPTTTGHFDEYAHISYQSFAQNSPPRSSLVGP